MTAASAGQQGRRRRGGRRHQPMSEINMTPFIDVMLVLLIIFMVAAPLLTVGVPLDLPKTSAAALNVDKQPLKVSVAADGKIYLMETPIKLEEIVPKLQAVAKTGQDERIFIFGDSAIAYGKVAEVMATVSAAGYRNLALVTAPAQKK
jgi:biopolymer transport protein TolR